VLHVRVWRSQIRDIDGVAVVGWGAAAGRQARQAEGEVPRSAGGGSLVRPGERCGAGHHRAPDPARSVHRVGLSTPPG